MIMPRVLLALLGTSLLAQTQAINLGPTPPPRVNTDLTVTYLLNAPNAREVLLADSVHAPGPPGIPLTKGPDGVWSVTTPPYELGTHYYSFVVDGVFTGDIGGTARTDRQPRGSFLLEQLDVRGVGPLLTDIRKVPHGILHIETFTSASLNRDVRIFVYTPPGFVAGEQVPVVYLLHGNLQFESGWSLAGFAERIADNLLADGQARRVILAMPDTGTQNRDNLPLEVIEEYLIEEVLPLVESKYVPARPVERYLAGLSAGANHTRYTGLRNPGLFVGLGLFGGGGSPAGMVIEQLFPKLLEPELYRHFRLLYFAVGNEDPALGNVRRMSESLERLGIPHHLNVTSGGHTWFNFRRYLAELLKGL